MLRDIVMGAEIIEGHNASATETQLAINKLAADWPVSVNTRQGREAAIATVNIALQAQPIALLKAVKCWPRI